MAKPLIRPLRLLVFLPCYAGNGGYSSLSVEVMKWWLPTLAKIHADPRIGEVRYFIHGDTPIDMVRNLAVRKARENDFDLLLMVDSDMLPDCELGRDPEAKPFWETAFDFTYERMTKSLPTTIFAPYCGGPPHENVFVFYPEELTNGVHGLPSEPDVPRGLHLEAYSRQHAAEMRGITPVGAGPTGLILYTTDVFDYRASSAEGQSFFYYEFNEDRSEKASTEDVTNTRDIWLAGMEHGLGDLVFCCWDSWAGHIKNGVSGKPIPIGTGRAAQKILALEERQRDVRNARMAAHLADYLGPHDDAPAPQPPVMADGYAVKECVEPAPIETPAPEPTPSPLANGTYLERYAVADERWTAESLAALEAAIDGVLEERGSFEGNVLVAYDRDLAATRLAIDAVLRRHPDALDDKVKVYYCLGENQFPHEHDAAVANAKEITKARMQHGVVSPPISQRPEMLDYDGWPMHLIVDLRREIPGPVCEHAYAYFTLSEPTWRRGETFYRREPGASSATFWRNTEFDPVDPQEAPNERREPICG